MQTLKFHIAVMSEGKTAFAECVTFYTHALKRLGYDVSYSNEQLDPEAINLVLGSYHKTTWKRLSAVAKNIIICNWEPVHPNIAWFSPRYFKQMTNAHVWDYNLSNVEKLKAAGVRDVHIVPLGYVSEMTDVEPALIQDIDVLFYGQISERRKKVLEALTAKGLNVVSCMTHGLILGDGRKNFISRAKVVLNMHNLDNTEAFEIVRVSYLLANRKAVVAEVSELTHVDADIKEAIAYGRIDELVDLCVSLVQDDTRRCALEQKGFEIFSQRNAVQSIKKAVDCYLAQRACGQIGNTMEHSTPLPPILQIGAADRWHYAYCNIDKQYEFAPDLHLDIGQRLPFEQALYSWRFGNVKLPRNYFQKIFAHYVFQRVDDLKVALTNCLELLRDDGILDITIPLDLSYDAWMHIDDKRVFNDKSWERILNNWWQYEWQTHRFHIISHGFAISGEYGMQVLAENGNDWSVALRTPRAVSFMQLTLQKRVLTAEELQQLPQARFMD